MNLRKITSLTAMLAFGVMLLTSIVLYIIPQGRVAYWADWHLWGLDKDQWGAIHINTGILFLLAIALHTYYNWKSITAYLKNRTRELKIFTPNFNAALVITLAVVLGTHFQLPPFSTLLNISAGIKATAAVKYGEPPYGHAELSNLESLTKKTNLDFAGGLKQLERAGFSVADPKASLKEIASANGVSPQRLYAEMQKAAPPKSAARSSQMPASPVPGLGKRQLAELLAAYGMEGETIIKQLASKGIEASLTATVKEVAELNKVTSLDIYDAIRALH
ncbi:MAG: DUF4405 domain-containing protein [Desulfosarcinaceae bacterium]|jgi:hypothetical protein